MSSPVETQIPIYPRSVKGRFRNFKYFILITAYSIYYGLPWLSWSRPVGPDQAVLFDIVARKYYLFGLVVQPQQIFWLAGFLIIAALLLFFITGVAGRVFCGFFCFQTLWTDLFFRIEKWVQGERPARIRLDKQPWSVEKIRKKAVTYGLWAFIAFWTGLTFTLYWGEAGDLVIRFFSGDAPRAMYITTLIVTFTTFTMAGMAREQTCTHMCPYSRFQSAMFDKATRVVAYDQRRGEGRSGRAKLTKGMKTLDARAEQSIGDCVDCGFCVQVCPTGIDIRNGMQIACIQCALCIDACNNIMDSLGWKRGLIRYSSEIEDQGGQVRFFSLKNVGYGLAILISTAVLVWSISTEADLETAIRQTRKPLYVLLSDGSIENSYEIKLINQTSEVHTYHFVLEGLDDATLDTGRIREVRLKPLQQLRILAKVKQSPGKRRGKVSDFIVKVQDAEGVDAAHIATRFYRP